MDMNTGPLDPVSLQAPPALATVRRIADGFKDFQVLRAGLASGLFDWLAAHGPAEKSAIAAALKLRGAHLGGFLQALEDLGLLARQGGAYALAPGLDAVLCAASPWCQAEVLDDLLAPSCGWSALDRFLAEGWAPPPAAVPPPLRHPFLGEARRLAAHLAARRGAAAPHRLLCFDGGDGLLAVALCRHFPAAGVTVAVRADALARAQQTIAACGLGERCRVVAGTPLDPPAGDVFDYIVVFHALYAARRATSDALAAVAACLAPDGELCCAHWFCLEACETAPGGLRDLDKAVLTDSHPLCHVEGFCQRLEGVGLIHAERADLAGEYGTTKLHFARCPGAHRGD